MLTAFISVPASDWCVSWTVVLNQPPQRNDEFWSCSFTRENFSGCWIRSFMSWKLHKEICLFYSPGFSTNFFFSGTFALIMRLILFIVGKLVIFCGIVFGGFLCWLIAFLGGLIQEKVDKCNLLTCFPCIPNYIFFGKIYTRYIKSGPHSCSWKSKVTIKFYGAQDKAHQLRIYTPNLWALPQLITLFTVLGGVFRPEIVSTNPSCSFKLSFGTW